MSPRFRAARGAVGAAVCRSGRGLRVCGPTFLVHIFTNAAPLRTVRMWEEAKFSLPDPGDGRAAQSSNLGAESLALRAADPMDTSIEAPTIRCARMPAYPWSKPSFPSASRSTDEAEP